MITNLRQINSRYRGPVESQKLSLFYQGVELNLAALKEQFDRQEQTLKKARTYLLSRDVERPHYITHINYQDSYYGISIIYPSETILNQVYCDWVGVLLNVTTLSPDTLYRPRTKAYPIEKIATLDRIFAHAKAFEIKPGMVPVESIVYADLDRVNTEQEVNELESH